MGSFVLPAVVAAESGGIADLRKQAAKLEKRRDWLEACRIYEDILRKDRGRDDIRRAYQRCLRRYHLVHRHRDKLYRQGLTRITAAQALEMYEQVIDTISRVYVDRGKTAWTALFQQGIEEVRLALEEPVFLRQHLSGVPRDRLEAFRDKLADWRQRKIASQIEAREQVMAFAQAAQKTLETPRSSLVTVLTLEFLSGACNALDEYTAFLPPGHLKETQEALQGRLVSIGVELAVVDGHLEISRVYPRSPAAEAGLMRHDRITNIDGRPTVMMSAETALERLRGKDGSVVELYVQPADQTSMPPMRKMLSRRPVIVPSVEFDWKIAKVDLMDDMGVVVGRLRITCFQETTLQEVREALASLQTDGMKLLILDLRGNPGGLFKSALKVAELFLPEGTIVVTRSHVLPKKLSGPIRSESLNPLLTPMVVLIDGETASSAEVLAAALKDNGRAILIGQTTYGKATLQCVYALEKPPFDKMPVGIRLTVAQLLSPRWRPFNYRGVRPDIEYDAEGDRVFAVAQRQLLDMLKSGAMPP